MAAHGTKNNPRYTLKDGRELRLRVIKGLILQRFNIELKKRYPIVEPPLVKLENGDLWRDVNDEWYKLQREERDQLVNEATAEFLFSNGVLDDPPADWQPFWKSDADPRYVWISEIIDTDDIDQLMNAIMGIDNVTPDGVEEAEKKSTPAGEDSP